MLLSAILGCVGLGRPALWIDEVHSFEFSALPSAWLTVLNAAARDAYPPLYFLLLHFWMKLGEGEAWLRLLSLAFHLASIPLVYLVASAMATRATGFAAAALLAVSPFHLAFAREVRMYSLLAFLALLSMGALVLHARRPGRRGFWLLSLSGLGLTYTHFMGVLAVMAQGAWMLLESRLRSRPRGGSAPRRRPRVFGRWAAVLVIGFLPWSPLFLKAAVVTRGYGSEAPPPLLLYWFLGAIGAGFAAPPAAVAIGFATVLALAWFGFRGMPAGPLRRLLVLWALLPAAVELAANLGGKSVFGARTLITSTPAWLILMAHGLSTGRWPRAAAGWALAGGLAAFSFGTLVLDGLPSAPAHGEAVEYVLKNAWPGDAIVHSATVTYHPVHEYYLPRSERSLRDFLIEPPGEFRSGRLGLMFREAWRAIRARVDPGGVLKTGVDPNRISEEELLLRRPGRIWYFHTTPAGKMHIWRLIPGRYYAPGEAETRTVPFREHRKLSAAYRRVRTHPYPGLDLELYERR